MTESTLPEVIPSITNATTAVDEEPKTPKLPAPEIRFNRAQRRRFDKLIRKTKPAANREQARERLVAEVRRGRAANGMRSLEIVKTRTRVVVQLASYLTNADAFFALGAIEQLKRQNDQLNFEFCTDSAELYTLLEGAWFLQARHLVAGELPLSIVGQDVGILLEEPDQQLCLEVEQAAYEAEYQEECAKLQEYEAKAHEEGMTDVKVQLPLHQFIPKWSKGTGYLHALIDHLGAADRITTKVEPYGDVASRTRRNMERVLQKAHITDKPFFLYHLPHEDSPEELVSLVQATFPHLKAINANTIKSLAPDAPLPLQISAATHPNCQLVFGVVDALLIGAWSFGQPKRIGALRGNVPSAFLALYEGVNFEWDGLKAKRVIHIDKNRWAGDSLKSIVHDTAKMLRNRMQR